MAHRNEHKAEPAAVAGVLFGEGAGGKEKGPKSFQRGWEQACVVGINRRPYLTP